MASYIEQSLITNEKIIYTGKISLWSLLPLILLGAVTMLMGFGFIFWIVAYLKYKSTELAFTNKRVIAKFGFIGRNTVELNIDKIEAIQVDQNWFGRIFNFGTLLISGAGNPQVPIPDILDPMTFRKLFLEFQDKTSEEN